MKNIFMIINRNIFILDYHQHSESENNNSGIIFDQSYGN